MKKKRYNTEIEEIREVYKDRSGYRIVYGTLRRGYYEDYREALEVIVPLRLKKRLGISGGECFIAPPKEEQYLGGEWSSYLDDLRYITDTRYGILSKSKVARRWFMERAKKFRIYKNMCLGDYLKKGTNNIDWNLINK